MPRASTALPALQKAYDECYLTCSTAVYYESQGNEVEATRCWKSALERIYDHQAHQIPASYMRRCSETEKALVDSLRQLEAQCKERVDLLEALRLSRQEDTAAASRSRSKHATVGPDELEQTSKQPNEHGGTRWIAAGTVPALRYDQLAKPVRPQAPPPPIHASASRRSPLAESLTLATTPPPLATAEAESRPLRTASLERHSIRTTLRHGRPTRSPAKESSPSRPYSSASSSRPGASKAATLAWTSLGLREQTTMAYASQQAGQTLDSMPYRAPERLPKKRWDSHTRTLVTTEPIGQEARVSERGGPGLTRGPRLSVDSPGRFMTPPCVTKSPVVGVSTTEPIASAASTKPCAVTSKDDNRLAQPWDVRPRGKSNDGSLHVEGERSPGYASLKSPVGAGVSPVRPPLPNSAKNKHDGSSRPPRPRQVQRGEPTPTEVDSAVSDGGGGEDDDNMTNEDKTTNDAKRSGDAIGTDPWKQRKAKLLADLPGGVDEQAAKQILNDVVVKGDEVHWSDIAGLEVAKAALRETVVYPFLRPDLFMGLREPAKGMLLFGPPGTGKTMLARAVATESKSTFFSISASSLTSKYLGESEKLVRALFLLARVLAPSIIFVDEIDSLLSQRSESGEHEASRRIKTEFFIQWSDLQRAAAGRQSSGVDTFGGDATLVLVLAATNIPWAIDEAARRRFVRRQYIPLPEDHTRATQLRTLLSQQKHTLTENDLDQLVGMTQGFSGSDITALAKDAAMGPLRSLGDELLHTAKDEIRAIELRDFISSLSTIRPSVNQAGLKAYEDWAREFGERGG